MLLPEIGRQQKTDKEVVFRANATALPAFSIPEEAELTLLPASGFNQDRNDERNDERNGSNRSARRYTAGSREGKMEVPV